MYGGNPLERDNSNLFLIGETLSLLGLRQIKVLSPLHAAVPGGVMFQIN